MAKGGKRAGAGRKPGPAWRPFRDFVSPEEKRKFVEFILDQYMGDMRLALWLGEQLYGKAPASIDITSGGEKLPTPIMGGITNQEDVSTDHGVSKDSRIT